MRVFTTSLDFYVQDRDGFERQGMHWVGAGDLRLAFFSAIPHRLRGGHGAVVDAQRTEPAEAHSYNCFRPNAGRNFSPHFGYATRSMHYERAALLSGVYRGDAGQESEEKIGKSAEE